MQVIDLVDSMLYVALTNKMQTLVFRPPNSSLKEMVESSESLTTDIRRGLHS